MRAIKGRSRNQGAVFSLFIYTGMNEEREGREEKNDRECKRGVKKGLIEDGSRNQH